MMKEYWNDYLELKNVSHIFAYIIPGNCTFFFLSYVVYFKPKSVGSCLEQVTVLCTMRCWCKQNVPHINFLPWLLHGKLTSPCTAYLPKLNI